MAKDKAGQASDALEEGARQAADTAQKVAADTSEAIESGAQQVRTPVLEASPLNEIWSDYQQGGPSGNQC